VGVDVNATSRPLYPQEREPVPIVQDAGWSSGPVWTGVVNLFPTGIGSLDRPARSKSLYHLSYPGSLMGIENLTLWRRNFLLNFSNPVFEM